MNQLAKQNNELINLPLKNFNAKEVDLFNTVCYEAQEKGTEIVALDLKELRKKMGYKSVDTKRFLNDLRRTNKKLMQLDFIIGTETEFTQFVLFPLFRVSEKENVLQIRVAEEFKYLLNNFKKNFTLLELQESNKLKSVYSKGIYKKLRRFKSTGKWKVPLEEFMEYLDIPSKYSTGKIEERVIKPAINELSPYFEGLNVKAYYEKSTNAKRGRPKVAGYEWQFKKQPNEENSSQKQEQIAQKTGWRKTPRYCPNCKRLMYSKYLENDNGGYMLYGHADWKTGECSYATTDFSTLLQDYQLKSDEPLTDIQRENQKNIQELLEKLNL